MTATKKKKAVKSGKVVSRGKLWFEGRENKKPKRIGKVLGGPIKFKPIKLKLGGARSGMGSGLGSLNFRIKFPKGFTKGLAKNMIHRRSSTIPMDMKLVEDALVVKVDLPGVRKEDIKVKVTPTTLTVEAKREHQDTEQGDNFFRQERSFGSVSRTVTLPNEVDVDNVKAKYENGVLRIVIKKVR
jgi:HSP20 family molecular chaperone IbpA